MFRNASCKKHVPVCDKKTILKKAAYMLVIARNVNFKVLLWLRASALISKCRMPVLQPLVGRIA